MPPLSPPEIIDVAHHRDRQFAEERVMWDKIDLVTRGKHRSLFPREFPEDEVHIIAGFIRRSIRKFARMIGAVPDIQIAPMSLEAGDQDSADRLERICFAYNEIWDMRRKANAIGWYLAGMGSLGMGVVPHPRSGFPVLMVEDPRNVLPGPGWEATSTAQVNMSMHGYTPTDDTHADLGGSLDDCIIRKRLNGRQMLQRFGHLSEIQDLIPQTSEAYFELYDVLAYYDDEWAVEVLEDNGLLLSAARHGVSWCPWQFPTVFDAGEGPGRSDFEQQIGLEVAFMRILDQKLSLNDSVVWPWIFQRGYIETDPENRLMIGGSPDSDVKVVSPPANFQVDRDMGIVENLLRQFNFETEASQGEISGGPVTGRGVVEMRSVEVQTVQAFFDDLSFYLPRSYTTALVMDRELFGGRDKRMTGKARGEPFFESYDPSESIDEVFGRVSVEFGPGLGQFDDHVAMLQQLGAEAISVDTIMEKNPHIRSKTAEKRKIVLEKAQKLLFESAMLGEAAVPPTWLAEFIEEVAAGADPYKWIAENPPEQAQESAEDVGPVQPGALPPGGQQPPGVQAAQQTVTPPPLEQFLGVGR